MSVVGSGSVDRALNVGFDDGTSGVRLVGDLSERACEPAGRWLQSQVVKMTLGQSRVLGAMFLLFGFAWIGWEESAKAGYVAFPPVTGIAPVFIAIGFTILYFYPRSLKGK